MRLYADGVICPPEDQEFLDYMGYSTISPKDVISFLEKREVGEEVEIWINSYGGDVWAAMEIYNLLKDYPGKKTALITGLAASAATIIMLGCDQVLATPGAQFMIHNANASADGDYHDMYMTAEQLKTANDALQAVYVKETGISPEKIKSMMERTTWFSAKDAVEIGLIDKVNEQKDIRVAASIMGKANKFDENIMNDYHFGISELKSAIDYKKQEKNDLQMKKRQLEIEKEKFL